LEGLGVGERILLESILEKKEANIYVWLILLKIGFGSEIL
jgi:hypothetical protein